MNRKRRAQGVRTREPRLSHQCRFAPAPKIEKPCKTSGQQGGEGGRRDLSFKARAFSIGQLRYAAEIDPESDGHPVPAPLEENSGELLPAQHYVIGPFQHHRQSRSRNVDGFDQRQARSERQALRRRVSRAKADERASEKIAFRRHPGAALAAPACELVQRDEPVGLNGLRVSEEIGVGRAGFVDDADAGQKRLPAA